MFALKALIQILTVLNKSRDSSVGIALGYGLDDRGSIPGWGWEFFCSNGPRAHPAYYPMDTMGSFLEGKAAGP
jgi:hypothetical protein